MQHRMSRQGLARRTNANESSQKLMYISFPS